MEVMARHSARGIWVMVALFFAGIAMPRARAATNGWRPVRLYQVDYISADEVAEHYGLKMTWLEKKKRLRLGNESVKIELEVNDREISWNGLRIFLSETIAPYQDTLCLSLDDVPPWNRSCDRFPRGAARVRISLPSTPVMAATTPVRGING
jgi:hypothetical protein